MRTHSWRTGGIPPAPSLGCKRVGMTAINRTATLAATPTTPPPVPTPAAPPAAVRRGGSRLEALAATGARQDRAATAALAVVGVVGGAVVGLALQAVWPVGTSAADLAYAVSVLAATVGTYGVLILLVLIARLPVLERAIGQDRLVIAHRRIAPWATGLVGLHVLLVVAAYAGFTGTGFWAQLWSQLTTTPWILPAAAGLVAMVAAAVTSWRRLRGRLRHETWWTIHLYTYLGVALAFAHQVTVGGPFLGGWARALWVGLYVAVFGAIAWFRVAVPLWRSWRHDLRVVRVVRETPDVVSLWIRGRHLERLGVRAGQFLNWRFAHPGLRYEAHPYSVSGLPRPVPGTRDSVVRITVKALGDSSAAVAGLPPGTRAFVEGPYGAVTPERVSGRPGGRVVLVAGGVGIAQVRALAEEFAGHVPVDVIFRASTAADLALAAELEAMRAAGMRVHLLAGSRHLYPMTPDHLRALVGTLEHADVYACGPQSLHESVTRSARALGAGPDRIHVEEFTL